MRDFIEFYEKLEDDTEFTYYMWEFFNSRPKLQNDLMDFVIKKTNKYDKYMENDND
jgi:hypothetical protein